MSAGECPSEGDGRGVLVVDDDSGIRHLLKDALSCVGYRVSCCEAGEDALELMSRKPFSLLLTDYELPGMNGIEVVRDLRARGDMVSAILMTGHDLGDLKGRCKGLDPIKFLNKLFGTSQLYAVVRTSVGIGARVQPAAPDVIR